MPFEAYIVDCVRTACGKKKGALSKWHPAELGAAVCDALVERTGVPGAAVDDVICGCVAKIGAQSANIGRSVVLSSKLLPETVPGVTIDRQCGSSQQAIHFAAQGVMSGTQDMVIAMGVEVMSKVPIGSDVTSGLKLGFGSPWGVAIAKKYKTPGFSQFRGAELLAKKYDITREEMDRFSVESHRKGAEATKAGLFDNEIITLTGRNKEGKKIQHSADQGIRAGVTYEKTASLKLLAKNGRISAATSSQIADGAAAVMVCNERAIRKYNLKPRAKIVSLALAGDDPVIMLQGPIPATQKCLEQVGMTIGQMDLYEVNEAFAPVPLAWAKSLGADLGKLNVNGGAMALGHPLGATGCKLMTTLVNALEQRNKTWGIQAICEGGGTANATMIKRVTGLEPANTSSKL